VLKALLCLAVLAAAPVAGQSTVVVMVDDADEASFRGLINGGLLPHIQSITEEGVRFPNSFATNPICAPSRATYLTGRYAHNHGRLRNAGSDALDPTFVQALQSTRYTAHVGKYLNGYAGDQVPAGWDDWRGLVDPSTYSTFNYQIRRNVETVSRGAAPADYQTSVLGDEASAAVSLGLASGKPLFLSVTPLAPHIELNEIDLWTFEDGITYSDLWRLFIRPDPRDQASKPARWNALATLPLLPGLKPSFNQPCPDRHVQRPSLSPLDIQWLTFGYRTRMLSLLAVDDLVGKVQAALGSQATTWIFTSDNGFFLGECGTSAKMAPYEEGIRVPLYIAGPGIAPGVQAALVLNTDLAATILDLAGLPADPLADGRSLVPLLHGTVPADWRRRALIEHWREPGDSVFDVPDYVAVRTGPTDTYPNRLYVEWAGGPVELYDLGADLYQLQSVSPVPGWFHDRLTALSSCAGASCGAAEGPLLAARPE